MIKVKKKKSQVDISKDCDDCSSLRPFCEPLQLLLFFFGLRRSEKDRHGAACFWLERSAFRRRHQQAAELRGGWKQTTCAGLRMRELRRRGDGCRAFPAGGRSPKGRGTNRLRPARPPWHQGHILQEEGSEGKKGGGGAGAEHRAP